MTAPAAPSLITRPWLPLAAITALALVLRLLFTAAWQHSPYGGAPYLDAAAYHDWAQRIAAGQWLSETAFYQSPLYPYLLGMLYSLSGPSPLAAALLNSVLGAAGCGLLACTAGRAFGPRALLLTGMLAAAYPVFIFYTPPVLKETLGLFLFCLFLFAFQHALESGKRRHHLAAGLALGLAVLTRGNALPLILALPLLSFRRLPFSQAAQASAVHVLGVFLALAPATLHNAIVSHDFVLTTYSGGFNVFIGHRPNANGANSYPNDIPTGNEEAKATTALAEASVGRALKPSQVSAYWLDKSRGYILNDPLRIAELWLRKTALLLSGQEFSDNYNVDFFRQELGSFLGWPVFPGFAVVLALAAWAVMAAPAPLRQRMAPFLLLAALYAASVLPFYVTDRYRLPLAAFLLPLAGAAAALPLSTLRQNAIATILALAIFAGSSFLPPRNPLYTMVGWLALGNMHNGRGDNAKALDYFSRAIAMAPHTVESYWYVKAAQAAHNTGQHDRAAALINQALREHPADEALIRANAPAAHR